MVGMLSLLHIENIADYRIGGHSVRQSSTLALTETGSRQVHCSGCYQRHHRRADQPGSGQGPDRPRQCRLYRPASRWPGSGERRRARTRMKSADPAGDQPDGKNVCRLNGRLITNTQLRQLRAGSSSISTNADGQQLLDERCHLEYLDGFGETG